MGEIPKQPIISLACWRSVYIARAPIWSVNSKADQPVSLDWSVAAPA